MPTGSKKIAGLKKFVRSQFCVSLFLDEIEWPPVLYVVTRFIKKTLVYTGSKVLDVLE